MFGKTLSVANLCAVLAVCSMLGMTSAIPVRRENAALLERDLQPIKSDAQIQPGMVDLLDQYQNLAQQVAAAPKGTPEFDALVTKMNSTKAVLQTKIKGIAVLVDSPTTNTTVNTTVAATSTTATSTSTSVSTTIASSTAPASSSTVTPGPSNKVKTGGPLTIVTQMGTSIVVLASQGTTSTVTLAPFTSSSPSPTATSAASGATSTFDINTMPAPDARSGPQPTGTSAAQSQARSGAMSLSSSMWNGSMLLAGFVVGALIAL